MQHHNKEQTKQHHPKGGREVEAPPPKKEHGKGKHQRLKELGGTLCFTLPIFLFFSSEKKREKAAPPKRRRIKQHHTKDGWNSSITQHRTSPHPKGEREKSSTTKKALGTTTLLYFTLVCLIVLQPHFHLFYTNCFLCSSTP